MYSRTISEINLVKKNEKIQLKLYKEEENKKEPYTVEINHKNKNDEILCKKASHWKTQMTALKKMKEIENYYIEFDGYEKVKG